MKLFGHREHAYGLTPKNKNRSVVNNINHLLCRVIYLSYLIPDGETIIGKHIIQFTSEVDMFTSLIELENRLPFFVIGLSVSI